MLMNAPNDIQNLMIDSMHAIADAFGNHAIIKGGIALQLLDCPRSTNDIDYVFIPYKSKKDILAKTVAALSAISGANVHHSINSKSLRCLVERTGISVQIEINVAQECPSMAVSSGAISKSAGKQGHIVRIMEPSAALAHKCAAWNERGLMRDLYDVYYLATILGTHINTKILADRLAKVEPRRSGKPYVMSLGDFAAKLKKAALDLNQTELESELRTILPPADLPGLALKIRAAMMKTVEELDR
jgi:predicted nucleotidyltransferase component of viral defense system